MSTRVQQFQAAVSEYVGLTKQQEDVIGIVVTGSFIHGQIDPNSDIDIFVILDPACDYRQRCNTWVNDVEIEYFMNPPQQVRAYLRQESSPHTAHMLSKGELVYQVSGVVAELIAEAKAILAQKPAPIQPFQQELAKYSLDDLWKDLEDSWHSQDPLAQVLLKDQMLNESINVFCKLHQIRRTKHKRLQAQLLNCDPAFLKIVTAAAIAEADSRVEIQALSDYMATLLGGERTKEWVLRTDLDL